MSETARQHYRRLAGTIPADPPGSPRLAEQEAADRTETINGLVIAIQEDNPDWSPEVCRLEANGLYRRIRKDAEAVGRRLQQRAK